MPAKNPETPLWPARLRDACELLLESSTTAGRSKAEGEIWQILNLALSIYLRSHARHMGGVAQEDLEDLAADKSLDLMTRIADGKSDFRGRAPGEIMSFFSKVSKNELLGFFKRQGRFVKTPEDQEGEREWDMSGAIGKTVGDLSDEADIPLERKEFSAALVECAKRLKPRARKTWLFRLLFNMASKDIAVHPKIDIEPSHVDVLLQRCRGEISNCMDRKGFRAGDLPQGVFAVLWQSFRGSDLSPGAGVAS